MSARGTGNFGILFLSSGNRTLTDSVPILFKHGKDCFYRKKKNEPLRTVVFHHPKNSVLEYRKTSLPAAPVPFRNRLTRIR